MQSIKMKTPLEERECIEIDGRKLYWMRLINMLDDERWHYDNTEYCGLICPLQYVIEEYVYGADRISDYYIDYAVKEGLDIPADMSFPSVIYDFYHQIETKLHINLSAALDKAAELSEKDLSKLSVKRESEHRRKETVSKFMEEISCDTDNINGKISWILSVQEKKKTLSYFTDEKQKEIENAAAELWCSILIHQLNYEYITYGQMLSLVQEDILAETDISDLLVVYGDNRDYEWYSEDCIGTSISENTKLKIEDILEMAEPVFSKILGL